MGEIASAASPLRRVADLQARLYLVERRGPLTGEQQALLDAAQEELFALATLLRGVRGRCGPATGLWSRPTGCSTGK